MEERQYLHDAERVLCTLRPSAGWLFLGLLRCLGHALLLGVSAYIFVNVLLSFLGIPPLGFSLLFIFLLLAGFFLFLRCLSLWRASVFRVTTDRILLNPPQVFFRAPLRTVKWAQYQESRIGRGNVFDLLFRARPLLIRYGSGEEDQFCYPSLPRARDLKHYLDQVDSALKGGRSAELRPFILQRRGERW
ncbi:hypothetical protein HYS30_01885 [Candidatus Peregrinibacteria bacterium]|nr:hypothetical protein [Candidatus Peregrinibacteria bacterium]